MARKRFTTSSARAPTWAGEFSAGATVTEQLPAGTFHVDFRRAKTFIIAIIPFDQIAVHFGGFSKPGQFASSAGALQGTGENFFKNQSGQMLAQAPGVAFAAFRQRQIGQYRCAGPKDSKPFRRGAPDMPMEALLIS